MCVPVHGTLQLVAQPHVVLVAKRKQIVIGAGLYCLEQRPKVPSSPTPLALKQSGSIRVPVGKRLQDIPRGIGRAIISGPKMPVAKSLLLDGVQLLRQVLRPFVSGQQDVGGGVH